VTEYNDIRCGDDVDAFARDARPLEVLAQDLYHWLLTDKMTLYEAPDWGFGLGSVLGRPIPSTLSADVENGVLRTFADRISSVRCVVTRVDGQDDSYRMDLKAAVEDTFLQIALQLTPSGIVRVA